MAHALANHDGMPPSKHRAKQIAALQDDPAGVQALHDRLKVIAPDDVQALRDHDVRSNPLGDDFNYAEAFKTLDLQAVKKMGEKVKQEISNLDVLINNAGISQRSLAIQTTFEEELKLIETDLIGVLAITKVALPEIIKQKGQVIVISSVMGKINTKYRTSYAAAKHGVTGYFESLRLEMIEHDVNVCNIIPGFIDTDVAKNSVGVTPEILAKSNNKNGLSPQEFALKAIKAIHERKGSVYIGKFKEKFAMLLKRFAPKLFDKVIINKKVV